MLKGRPLYDTVFSKPKQCEKKYKNRKSKRHFLVLESNINLSIGQK